MSAGRTFDSPREFLSKVLEKIHEGEVQLPDFQRGWIWDDEHIRSLLASVSLSYPIGAAMAMVTGNTDVRFKPRLFEGVNASTAEYPEWLVLDGQQRLTSLYQALYSGRPVATRDSRNKPISRWYYLDINKALEENCDREDAIRSFPEDRIVRNFRGEILEDYSSREQEYHHDMFPFAEILKSSEWRLGYQEYWQYDREKIQLFNRFEAEIVKTFEQYLVLLIVLGQDTPKEAVCQVFEKVNTGGVPLSVFELLTATFAADDFNLREDWETRSRQLRREKVLSTLESTDFLQSVALLATRERRLVAIRNGLAPERAPAISCKRKDILRLTLSDYKRWADRVTEAYAKIPRFLYNQKVFAARDVPYRTQMVPLAATFAVLGDDAENDTVRSKLVRWFWCGVFGELYGSATETRFAKDLPELLAWIDGGPEPDTIRDANFAPARLQSLRTRNSAAYKGLHALLMKDGGLDFQTGYGIDDHTYAQEQMDIHHIFPQSWCRRQGIDEKVCNSIINKTPLSRRTNQIIGGRAPSSYLERIQNSIGISGERMDEMLRSHVIEPELLRSDNFQEFMNHRQRALLERIEQAMGKPIAWDSIEFTETEPLDDDDDEAA